MARFTEPLEIGKRYDRQVLARLWGLAGFEAISRGVYTPAGQKLIILFVTREKQDCLTQYRDFLQEERVLRSGHIKPWAKSSVQEARNFTRCRQASFCMGQVATFTKWLDGKPPTAHRISEIAPSRNKLAKRPPPDSPCTANTHPRKRI
jgi:hypothetical protein